MYSLELEQFCMTCMITIYVFTNFLALAAADGAFRLLPAQLTVCCTALKFLTDHVLLSRLAAGHQHPLLLLLLLLLLGPRLASRPLSLHPDLILFLESQQILLFGLQLLFEVLSQLHRSGEARKYWYIQTITMFR
jgi:hypothetical protein